MRTWRELYAGDKDVRDLGRWRWRKWPPWKARPVREETGPGQNRPGFLKLANETIRKEIDQDGVVVREENKGQKSSNWLKRKKANGAQHHTKEVSVGWTADHCPAYKEPFLWTMELEAKFSGLRSYRWRNFWNEYRVHKETLLWKIFFNQLSAFNSNRFWPLLQAGGWWGAPVPSECKEEGLGDDKVTWPILREKLPIYCDSLKILDLEDAVNSDMLLLLEMLLDVLLWKPFTIYSSSL